MKCPLCGTTIQGPGRLLYPLGLGLWADGTTRREPEHVCSRCYLALSPQESAARRGLYLVDLAEAARS